MKKGSRKNNHKYQNQKPRQWVQLMVVHTFPENTIEMPREEYESLVASENTLSIIARMLEDEDTTYVDGNTLRLILGLPKKKPKPYVPDAEEEANE